MMFVHILSLTMNPSNLVSTLNSQELNPYNLSYRNGLFGHRTEIQKLITDDKNEPSFCSATLMSQFVAYCKESIKRLRVQIMVISQEFCNCRNYFYVKFEEAEKG